MYFWSTSDVGNCRIYVIYWYLGCSWLNFIWSIVVISRCSLIYAKYFEKVNDSLAVSRINPLTLKWFTSVDIHMSARSMQFHTVFFKSHWQNNIHFLLFFMWCFSHWNINNTFEHYLIPLIINHRMMTLPLNNNDFSTQQTNVIRICHFKIWPFWVVYHYLLTYYVTELINLLDKIC